MREDAVPIVQNQPAPGDLKRGDYVFASRWSDCDPGDPWEVGFVSLVGEGYVVLSGPRHWRKAMRITQEQGHRICAQYPAMEGMPLDYEAIAKVFGVTPPGELEYASWISALGVSAAPAPKTRRRLTSDGNGGFAIVTEPDTPGVNPVEAPSKPITSLAEFCAEGERLGLTAADLVEPLSKRPEFADCLPGAPAPKPIAWIRRHPDGAFTGELLLDENIEEVRKRSGSWVPLGRIDGVPAFDASKPCLLKTADPTRTYCERCKNPHHACDGGGVEEDGRG